MTRGFYFQPGDGPLVAWETSAPVVLANPEWIQHAGVTLADIERQLPRLDGHVWVATSGTSREVSGAVRWVALSKQAFLASARAVTDHLRASASDVWAHALPTFHVGGLGILARAHLSGARVVAAVQSRWDAASFHETARASGAPLSALVTSQIHDLVEARLTSPPALRAIVVGGARLEPALFHAARELGWPCLPSYGLTETCSQVATASLESLSGHDCPTALPILGHAEIRAGDDQRLSVRGESLLTCYAELDVGGTRAWDPKRGGWLETEDLGRVESGLVEVLGRASESVKVLGEMVSLTRVEDEAWRWAAREGMRALPWFDLAVVALPHARLGHELVLAFAGPALPAERRAEIGLSLDSFCREALLPFERVHRVAWVDSIPRTPLGKVRRARLAQRLQT
jgi:O-succinylbenzoic acid--CoA ligase